MSSVRREVDVVRRVESGSTDSVSFGKVRRSVRSIVDVVEESVGYEGRVGSNAFRESSEGLSKHWDRGERDEPRKKWGSIERRKGKSLQHLKEQRWCGYHLGGGGEG